MDRPAGPSVWRVILRIGIIGGAVALYLCLVGIVPVFATGP